jgi:hypothetical protein
MHTPEICSFAFHPWGLGRSVSVCAAVYDLCDPVAEAAPDLLQNRETTPVLNSIVQQRCYRFILVSPIIERDASNSEQVRNVRDGSPLAHLPAVDPGSKNQCIFKPF